MQIASMHFKERAHDNMGNAQLQGNLQKIKGKFVAKRRESLVELDDFEATRDALLAVSGRLDPTIGGRSVPLTESPFSNRRTVYGFVDRQNLDGVYRTFDFASPDATSARRHVTTVPQQALFLMNNPFVIEQARQLAEPLEAGPPHLPPALRPVAHGPRAGTGRRVCTGRIRGRGRDRAGVGLAIWIRGVRRVEPACEPV